MGPSQQRDIDVIGQQDGDRLTCSRPPSVELFTHTGAVTKTAERQPLVSQTLVMSPLFAKLKNTQFVTFFP